MSTPIVEAVKKYIDRDAARMHMPGHKGHLDGFLSNIAKYDLTEVTGTDSLYECSECILQCEREYSKIYQTKRSIISTGGSTLCIQTMLALIAKDNGKIVAGRNIHISAVNAMGLLNLNPVWVYPIGKSGDGIPGEILSSDIENAIKENPDVLGVYITTPDYFGVLSDVKSISDVCHKYNIPLLVDNAHGALLKFLETSLHPIDLGADLCCDSLHKTLPVLTGGAMLHIGNEKYVAKAKETMNIFGSTSPSYIIMQSIDMALEYIKNDVTKDFNALKKWTDNIKILAKQKGFDIPKGILDPSKLALGFAPLGYTYDTFYQLLLKHNIEHEYMSDTYCVLMPSMLNSHDELKRVEDLILNIDPIGKKIVPFTGYEKPEAVMTIRDAMFSNTEIVKLDKFEGRISAIIKSKCPPGIPLVIPGEKISKEVVKVLNNYGIKELNVVQCKCRE